MGSIRSSNALPAPLRSEDDVTRAIVAFNAGVIEATSDLVYAYKPNLAFYMAHGVPGLRALEETRRLIPRHIPVLLDAKVGDLANTSVAYAAGYFDAWGFDAVTVNPYLGEDSLAPFLSRGDRGIIVVCKTSNPGSGDLQDIPVLRGVRQQSLYLTVADRVAEWSERWPATLGLVVGSTWPGQLAEIRHAARRSQSSSRASARRAGISRGRCGLAWIAPAQVCCSPPPARSSSPATCRGELDSEVRRAAVQLRDEINAARAVTA